MLSSEQKNSLIAELAQNAVFDGWGDSVLADTACQMSLDPVFAAEAFPTPKDRILAHSRLADESLTQWVDGGGLEDHHGVRGCLHALIMQRFRSHDGVKLAVQKGMSHVATPLAAPAMTAATWETMDVMWSLTAQALEHSNQDNRFDYASKRTLLGGVYAASMLAWFDDQGEDLAKTDAFVRARLDNVVGIFSLIGKGRAKIKQMIGR